MKWSLARRASMCGVGAEANPAGTFSMFAAHTGSSFSATEVAQALDRGAQVSGTLTVPIVTLADLVRKEWGPANPDFLSIDVEGWDEAIVLQTDWQAVRPAVICVETREYRDDASGRRITSIAEKLLSEGYGLAGLTYYNSIFADRSRMAYP